MQNTDCNDKGPFFLKIRAPSQKSLSSWSSSCENVHFAPQTPELEGFTSCKFQVKEVCRYSGKTRPRNTMDQTIDTKTYPALSENVALSWPYQLIRKIRYDSTNIAKGTMGQRQRPKKSELSRWQNSTRKNFPDEVRKSFLRQNKVRK